MCAGPVVQSARASLTSHLQLPGVQRAAPLQARNMTADQAATLPDPDCVAVYVTVPDKATGKSLAGALVERRLAACVNIVVRR